MRIIINYILVFSFTIFLKLNCTTLYFKNQTKSFIFTKLYELSDLNIKDFNLKGTIAINHKISPPISINNSEIIFDKFLLDDVQDGFQLLEVEDEAYISLKYGQNYCLAITNYQRQDDRKPIFVTRYVFLITKDSADMTKVDINKFVSDLYNLNLYSCGSLQTVFDNISNSSLTIMLIKNELGDIDLDYYIVACNKNLIINKNNLFMRY